MEGTGEIPVRSSNLSRKIVAISAGEAHTLALTGKLLHLMERFALSSVNFGVIFCCVGDGKVYSWGRGTFGRLGTGSEEDRHMPVRVRFFGSDEEREEKLVIVGVAAGAYHSLALAGSNPFVEFFIFLCC